MFCWDNLFRRNAAGAPRPHAHSLSGGPDAATMAVAISELLSAARGDLRHVLQRWHKVLLTENALALLVAMALETRRKDPERTFFIFLLAELLDRARQSGIRAAVRRPPVGRQLFETQKRWMLLESDLCAQRRFLEEHLELLSYSSLALLQRMVAPPQPVYATQGTHIKINVESRGAMNRLWLLLFDARQRGGDVQAIRDAYVNWHGGFALGVPGWLGPIIERDRALQHSGHRSQRARQRIALWKGAIEHAQRESGGLVPEVQAEMHVKAQEAYDDAHGLDKPELQQRERACLLFSLNIYTRARYPYAWAHRQARMGALYLNDLQGDRAENIEKAIACLQAVLHFFTEQDVPFEWAQTHNYLGWAYRDRLQGNREENQEQGMLFFEAALRVLSEDEAPIDWAMIQSNLGVLYLERLRGPHTLNLRSAIACLQMALRVFTQETSPREWALTQMELGNALSQYSEGDPTANRQQAITCFQAALCVYTEEHFQLEWAMTQSNLGNMYGIQANASKEKPSMEQAIAHHQASLRVFTEQDFPVEWARSQNNLGTVYIQRQQGDEQENCKKAIACLQAALQVYTRQAFPELHRSASLNLAYCAARNGLWELTHTAAVNAQEAEEDLLALAAGVKERDTILLQGEERVFYDAFALTRLGRHAQAAESIERGRARSLAAAHLLNAADPQRIGDLGLREAYLMRRSALQEAQATLQQATHRQPGREEWLARVSRQHQARAAFDEIISTIRAAKDPADFLYDDFSAETLLHIIAEKPTGYALIYLLLTPWGGLAVGILNPAPGTSPRFVALDLPALTPDAFHREAVKGEESYLWSAFHHRLLKNKLDWLAEVALRPLAIRLLQEGISSLTLIPCGILAAFPLLSVPLGVINSQLVTLADCCVASVAPNARSIFHGTRLQRPRHGVASLGDPCPTCKRLRWGEAEALTLAHLGGDPSRAVVRYEADRTQLLAMLRTAKVVAASCHGLAAEDYLQSCLSLANGTRLTLADALNGAITDMHGLRLFILSACQTAVPGFKGAIDEVRSLAVGMLQAGARAALASLWSVDDRATYLLMVRFAQEWFPRMESEPPAAALARAQRWLRTVTNRELQDWQAREPLPEIIATLRPAEINPADLLEDSTLSPGRGTFSSHADVQDGFASSQRYTMQEAEQTLQEVAQRRAQRSDPADRPYADPFYWAGFQLYGW